MAEVVDPKTKTLEAEALRLTLDKLVQEGLDLVMVREALLKAGNIEKSHAMADVLDITRSYTMPKLQAEDVPGQGELSPLLESMLPLFEELALRSGLVPTPTSLTTEERQARAHIREVKERLQKRGLPQLELITSLGTEGI